MLDKTSLKQMAKNKKLLKEQSELVYSESEDFVLFCYVSKNPQSYGTKLQNRFIQKNKMIQVPSSMNKGDAIDVDGNYKEVKCSIGDNGTFHAVQIRPYQDIYSYILCFFEVNEEGGVFNHFFEIPSKDMLKLPGISVAHGTKSSLNKEKEYRITFSMNSNDGQQFSA